MIVVEIQEMRIRARHHPLLEMLLALVAQAREA
jgi:hypothetical protein